MDHLDIDESCLPRKRKRPTKLVDLTGQENYHYHQTVEDMYRAIYFEAYDSQFNKSSLQPAGFSDVCFDAKYCFTFGT